MTKKIILFDYIFYFSKNKLCYTTIDNYTRLKKYKYNKKIKLKFSKKIHSFLENKYQHISDKINQTFTKNIHDVLENKSRQIINDVQNLLTLTRNMNI